MAEKIWQVDAFSAQPFKGNPAAVCLPARGRDEGWMQALAAEMNLSETAFLEPRQDGFGLRWFTPGTEVDLCGHATLAAAHVLWSNGLLAADAPARFHTKSGLLVARRLEQGWIELDFPRQDAEETAPPAGLAEALGLQPSFVGRSPYDYLVAVELEETVRELKPDLALLAGVETRGVMITAPSEEAGVDFVSRFFAPAVGIAEDPVTGSAHCTLGPFWAQRLGKSELNAWQVSPRGGFLKVRVGDERVYLAGQAVTVMSGELG